jgi:hypothetical protein
VRWYFKAAAKSSGSPIGSHSTPLKGLSRTMSCPPTHRRMHALGMCKAPVGDGDIPFT